MTTLPAETEDPIYRPPVEFDRLAARTDLPLPEVFRRVCEAAADALRVERAGVWLFVNGDRAVLRCVSLFERSKRRHSKGACMPLTALSEYVRAVAAAPLLATADAPSDPRTAELGDAYLGPNGITSLLDAPLMRDDRLVGVLCLEHVGPPRGWTDADRATGRAAADLVVEKMKAAEGALRAPPCRPVVTVVTAPADAAHDFRNVLAEILANAELIGRIPGLPPGAAGRLAKIAASAERGVTLLRSLLAPAPAPKAADDTGEYPCLPAE